MPSEQPISHRVQLKEEAGEFVVVVLEGERETRARFKTRTEAEHFMVTETHRLGLSR